MPDGLVVLTAPRLDRLADWLADRMAREPLPPLHRETVVIAQNAGLRDWLTLALADRLGCAAGLDLVTPRGLVGRLVYDHAGLALVTGPGGERLAVPPFEREGLRWRLHALLARLPADAVFDPVRDFAGRVGPEGPPLLAERLAALFDDYQVYRPDVLACWQAGAPTGEAAVDGHPHAPWQAALWRALAGETLGESRGEQLDALLGAMEGWPAPPDRLPRRVTVFGAGLFPPAYLRVLHALGRHVPVHALTVTPTGGRPPDAFAHPLLDALGRRAVEHGSVLAETGATFEALPDGDDETAPATLLGHLQASLLADAVPDAPFALDPDDASLTVHDCHSPRRELEVLRDQLLDAFDRLPGLRPHDVLVVVPDLSRYAPLVDAVFGDDALPVHVVNHPHSPARRVLDAVGLLLAVPLGRVTATDLLDLLDAPALRRAAGLRADEVPALREWTRAAGVRWGRDGAHRAALGLPASALHTWQHGLDRLLLGVAMGDGAPLVDGCVPSTAATDPDLLGRFAEWTARLFACADEWSGPPQPVEAWAARIGEALDGLVAPADDDEHEAVLWLRGQAEGLRHVPHLAAPGAPPGTPVPFADVRRALLGAMDLFAPRRRTLTGRVTVADPVALRYAPFRVVAFLGLGAGTWPPVHTPDALDLMAVALRNGDDSPASGGRLLVLDALLAARDRLLLSFVGRSERDNAPLAPSPALASILDALDACVATPDGRPASQHLVVPHRLQPFSPAYFDGRDGRLFSYRRPAARAARRAAHFFEHALPPPEPPPASVTARELADAWAHPSRYVCRHRLGVTLAGDAATADPDDEPLGLDGLDAWGAKEELLDARAGANGDARDRLLASGRLPAGALGEVWADRLLAAVAPVASARAAVPGGRPLAVEAGGTLPGPDDAPPAAWTVTAHLDHADDAAGVAVVSRPGRIRTADLVGAWAGHLVWSVAREAAGQPTPETRLVGEREAFRFGAVHRPATYLDWLVRGWHAMRERPVPLFADASRAYADERHKTAWQADPYRAVEAAAKVFDGGWQQAAERDDPYVRLCFDGVEPVGTAEFEKWARCLWKPLLASIEPL